MDGRGGFSFWCEWMLEGCGGKGIGIRVHDISYIVQCWGKVGRGCIAIIIVRRVELCDSGWAVAAGEYLLLRHLSSSCFPGSDGVASSIRNSFFPSRKKKVIMYVR